MDSATMTALVEEATRRAGLIWVRAIGGDPAPRALWHGWADGHAYLVTGGSEQEAPAGLIAGGRAEVTVASKDKGSRLVTWLASVATIGPDDEHWPRITSLLQAKRQNSPEGDAAPLRWAEESTVFALTPTGDSAGTQTVVS